MNFFKKRIRINKKHKNCFLFIKKRRKKMTSFAKGVVHIKIEHGKGFSVNITPSPPHSLSIGSDKFTLLIEKTPTLGAMPKVELMPVGNDLQVKDSLVQSVLASAAQSSLCIELEIDVANKEIVGVIFPKK